MLSRQASRLADLWREAPAIATTARPLLGARRPRRCYRRKALPELPAQGSLTFVQDSLAEGFVLVRREDNQILLDLLTDAEVFGWKRPVPRRERAVPAVGAGGDVRRYSGRAILWCILNMGSAVLPGSSRARSAAWSANICSCEYSSSDTLYVPVHHADRLGKWVGPDDRASEDAPPGRESRGAGRRANAAAAADELADELLDLYARGSWWTATPSPRMIRGRRSWKPASPIRKRRTSCA